VLHIGDHDPSGVSMFLAFLEDVEAFTRDLGGDATFTRLAVTPAQVTTYDLPTAPPKPTDKRAFAGQTCQAEALAPVAKARIRAGITTDGRRLGRRSRDMIARPSGQAASPFGFLNAARCNVWIEQPCCSARLAAIADSRATTSAPDPPL
jgi:hypothetical protein